MNKSVSRQAFVSLPLLRAIDQLPEVVDVDGVTLRLTGEVTGAPIVGDLLAYRARVEWEARGQHGVGHLDLSSASSWRSEMVIRLEGTSAARAEELLLGLRAAMVAKTESRPVASADDRIDVCRTA